MRQIHISIIKPSYHLRISEDLHRFARNLQDMSEELFLLLFLNNFTTETVTKNNFERKCWKFLANLCKSLEILEQCHVKWWLKYRNNRSVSWRLSLKEFPNGIINFGSQCCYAFQLEALESNQGKHTEMLFGVVSYCRLLGPD